MKKRIYSWYLILVIIYIVFFILEQGLSMMFNAYLFTESIGALLNAIMPISMVLGLVYFILNLVMFFVILAKRIERISLWIPGLNLAKNLFVLVVSLSLLANPIQSHNLIGSYVNIFMGYIVPIIAGIIAVKLLFRKNIE